MRDLGRYHVADDVDERCQVYLLYVDESGDVGTKTGSSRYFVLSGLVVHELRWHATLHSVIAFRRSLKSAYGIRLREEIHAGHFIHHPGPMARIPKSMRLRLLRDVIDFEATLPDMSILNVVVDKRGKSAGYDVTDEAKLRVLTRRMRVYNPIPNIDGTGYRQLPLQSIVEDAVHRNSLHSYFIQLADVNAYFLYQKQAAAGYVKKKGARNYFDRLGPALCTVASNTDPQGIVRL